MTDNEENSPIQRFRALPDGYWDMSEKEKRRWATQFLRDMSPNSSARRKKRNPEEDI